MKIKVSEAEGRALNWLVAKCEGDYPVMVCYIVPKFSTDWAQGGPIIEREKIATQPWLSEGDWGASVKGGFFEQHGPTPLVAAMRCLVASKLGDEVEVPDELC